MENSKQLFLLFFICITTTFSSSFYGNIKFDKNSATIPNKEQPKLNKYISELKNIDLQKENKKIVITGFTDQSDIEDSTLSINRATAVRDFIVKNSPIKENSIIVRGADNTHYRILNVTKEGQRLNRRAEITVLKVKKKKSIPLELNIIDSKNRALSNQNDSLLLKEGDTISVKEGGYCNLALGSRVRFDLNEKSVLTINKRDIVLVKGKLVYNKTKSDEKNVPIIANDCKITGVGEIVIDKRDSSNLFISILDGNIKVISKFGTTRGKSMQGIAILNDRPKVIVVDLPQIPTIKGSDTLWVMPGTEDSISWSGNGDEFNVIIAKDSNEIINKVVKNNTITFKLKEGKYQIQVRSTVNPGFRSLWSPPKTFTIVKKQAVKILDQFQDTLFLVSHNRKFRVSGAIDTRAELFLDSSKLTIHSDGSFDTTFYLKDDLNKLFFISKYPDNSKDTIEAWVLYTGADEAIYINDSIMGKPAFTSSRYYVLKGFLPTVTKFSINDTTIELGENKRFSKKFKLKAYGKYPVKLDLSFENGYSKTINMDIDRTKNDGKGQRALFTALGLLAVAALFTIITLQSNSN